MDRYNENNTPFDQYDSQCHRTHNGIISNKVDMEDEQLLFLIHLSEKTKRPEDMLMFLGEYFKYNVKECDEITENVQDKDDTKK